MNASALTATAALTLSLFAGVASPAVAADQGVNYRGSFDARVFSECKTIPDEDPITPETGTVTGSWRVNVHASTATARFVIAVDGVPHVAYTTKMNREVDDGATFTATTKTGAGDLVVRLSGTEFTYTISPYTDPFAGAFECGSVVYSGTSR